jgi:phosphonate transport system substrate-binding protein
MVLSSPAMNLAAVWLDVELAKKSLPQTTKLVGKITEATKAAKTVLPVFFNQADACLITRRAFDTMVELNPQVGRQLRVIATSPDYIASLFGFLTDVPTELKEKTIRAFSRLHTTTIGLQTLTLFQTDTILECPVATFAPSLALLDEHARLCPEASAALITSLRDPHHAP